MTCTRILLLATVAVLCVGGQGQAYGASFGAAQALDLRVTGPLAAAVGSGGEAVVAGVRRGPGKDQVAVATRARPGGPWNNRVLGPVVTQARDVQALITRDRAVVAWAEARRHRQSVVVATGRAGGALTLLRRVPVADAFAASPRLARLRSGAVVLAWRDGTFRARSRVRVATLAGTASRPRRAPSAQMPRWSCWRRAHPGRRSDGSAPTACAPAPTGHGACCPGR